MKANCLPKILMLFIFLAGIFIEDLYAQEKEAPVPMLNLKYFLPVSKVPYVKVITQNKVGRKFEPLPGVTVSVYLGEAAESNLLGKVVTSSKGEGRVAFPAALQSAWDSMDVFTIVAESVPSGKAEPLTAELQVKKAIMGMDTLSEDGVRSVTAWLKEKQGSEWVIVPDVEMKLRIKRLLGNLTVGEAESYTADSSGIAIAEFKKDSMPGDAKGNIILVASVEDNDTYGNLEVERTAPWGKAAVTAEPFWHRTLWSTGNRAPLWLIVLAGGIIVGVWGTLLFLLAQLFRIRKMGKLYEASHA
jgi:hypothetical protein